MTALYQLSQLQFSYSKKIILKIDQLDITAGDITALLGDNGAGKSTLLSLLAFLENPQQGRILFQNKEVNHASRLSFRKRVALVAQKPYLLKGTVLDNLLLGLKFRSISSTLAKQHAFDALDLVGISDFSDRHIKELSGGEAQKVALARALALQPDVLLLDEPFSHLDQESIKQLSQLIIDFSDNKQRSVVFSAHDKPQATALANQIITLSNGKNINKPF
jgi:ABC-type sulfate/molybdate transport systems ATPase subunit